MAPLHDLVRRVPSAILALSLVESGNLMATWSQRRRFVTALAGLLTLLLAFPAAVATESEVSLEPVGFVDGDMPAVAVEGVEAVWPAFAERLPGFSRFVPTPEVLEDSTPWRDLVVDLDGDGYDEIIYGYSSAVTVMRGTSLGLREIDEYLLGETGDHAIAIGDYNSDGFLDMGVGYSQDSQFAVFYGEASGGFGDRVDFPSGRSHSVASVDVNGMGAMIWRCATTISHGSSSSFNSPTARCSAATRTRTPRTQPATWSSSREISTAMVSSTSSPGPRASILGTRPLSCKRHPALG